MIRRTARFASIALGLLALALPSQARANGLLLFGPQGSQTAIFLLSTGSLCVDLTYDPNGNRMAQGVSVIGSGMTLWGAGTFGCFVWSQ